jgi:hypothetical protein
MVTSDDGNLQLTQNSTANTMVLTVLRPITEVVPGLDSDFSGTLDTACFAELSSNVFVRRLPLMTTLIPQSESQGGRPQARRLSAKVTLFRTTIDLIEPIDYPSFMPTASSPPTREVDWKVDYEDTPNPVAGETPSPGGTPSPVIDDIEQGTAMPVAAGTLSPDGTPSPVIDDSPSIQLTQVRR